MFVDLLAGRVKDAIGRLSDPSREKAAVVFSAHSLPVRTSDDGSLRCKSCDCEDRCRYRDGLQKTADLVGDRLKPSTYTIGWQSAGRTGDPWWGPPLEDVIRDLAANGHRAVVVCSAGFVADHLETDVLRAAVAARGVQYTAMGPWSAGTTLVMLSDSTARGSGAAGQATIAGGGPGALAGALGSLFRRITRVLNDPPFNFVLHTAPLHEPQLDHFHWHLEVIPKLTRVAGFEWGSGFFINPVAPEDAATALREAGDGGPE